MKKKASIVLALVLFVSCLTACGSSFDASKYVSSLLEVSYTGETETYLEMTDDTQENAEQIFENTLDNALSEYEAYITDPVLLEQYRELFADILRSIPFTVGEAVELDNGDYTVDVTVTPLTIFDDCYDQYMQEVEAYQNKLAEDVANGQPVPDEETLYNANFQIFYDCLKATYDAGLSYGEPETVTLNVCDNGDGVYSISEDELSHLDSLTLVMTKY